MMVWKYSTANSIVRTVVEDEVVVVAPAPALSVMVVVLRSSVGT